MCRLSCFTHEPPCPQHHLASPHAFRAPVHPPPAVVRHASTGFVPPGLREHALTVPATGFASVVRYVTHNALTPTPPEARFRAPSSMGQRLVTRLPAPVAQRWLAAAALGPGEALPWRDFFVRVAVHLFGSEADVALPLNVLQEGFRAAGLASEWRAVCRQLPWRSRKALMAGTMSAADLLQGYAAHLASWKANRTPMGAAELRRRLRREGSVETFWEAVRWFDHGALEALVQGKLSPAQFFTLHGAAAQLRPDVVVVGAGAAGLAAAGALRDAGLRVTVVETRHAVGGRARTQVHGFATRVDLGAARLHSGDVNPLAPVAERLGFTLHPDAPDGLALMPGVSGDSTNAGLPPNEWEAFDAVRTDITDALFPVATGPKDRTVAEVPMARDNRWFPSALASLIPLQTGVDAHDQSVEDYFRIMPEAHGDWWVEEGLGEMVSALATGLDVHLDTHVQRIEHDANRVRVHTGGAVYTAAHVVVTVSLGELPKLTFAPPLPAWKTTAIDNVPMGAYEKVILQFSRNIFGDVAPGAYLQVACPEDEPMDFSLMPPLQSTGEAPGAVVVVAYAGGKFAESLAHGGKDAAVAAALARLRTVYGHAVDDAFDKGGQTCWETWTGGAYSAARPGHYGARRVLGMPVGKRLHFAGEACESKTDDESTWSTHVAGAYNSGLAAAAEILAQQPVAAPVCGWDRLQNSSRLA